MQDRYAEREIQLGMCHNLLIYPFCPIKELTVLIFNSNNSPSTATKKEQTPEPVTTESRPSPISKEENSSVTEDDASECDSDSSATKAAKTGEFGVEDSPSRMRTRNKPTKEAANKRPKRGGTETPDATAVDSPKTPNKTEM